MLLMKVLLLVPCLCGSITVPLSKWMTYLPDSMTSVPINQLIIPGSHNSGASLLEHIYSNSTVLKFVVTLLNKTGIVYKWSITQSFNFTEQLHYGVRYFDIRCAYIPQTEDHHFLHNVLYGTRISKSLQEVRRFLKENPGEFVILDFTSYHYYSVDQHRKLASEIIKIFDKMMFTSDNYQNINITFKELRNQKKQVIAFTTSNMIKEEYSEFWSNNKLIFSPWPNTDSVQELQKFVEDNILPVSDTKLGVLQAVMSFKITTIFKHFGSSLKMLSTNVIKQVLITWLKNRRKKRRKINIVLYDFIDKEVTSKLVQMNFKLSTV